METSGTRGGTRTLTVVRPTDFKSVAAAITPLEHEYYLAYLCALQELAEFFLEVIEVFVELNKFLEKSILLFRFRIVVIQDDVLIVFYPIDGLTDVSDVFVYVHLFVFRDWPRRDLNPQPIGYEPTALTIELQGRKVYLLRIPTRIDFLVAMK